MKSCTLSAAVGHCQHQLLYTLLRSMSRQRLQVTVARRRLLHPPHHSRLPLPPLLNEAEDEPRRFSSSSTPTSLGEPRVERALPLHRRSASGRVGGVATISDRRCGSGGYSGGGGAAAARCGPGDATGRASGVRGSPPADIESASRPSNNLQTHVPRGPLRSSLLSPVSELLCDARFASWKASAVGQICWDTEGGTATARRPTDRPQVPCASGMDALSALARGAPVSLPAASTDNRRPQISAGPRMAGARFFEVVWS